MSPAMWLVSCPLSTYLNVAQSLKSSKINPISSMTSITNHFILFFFTTLLFFVFFCVYLDHHFKVLISFSKFLEHSIACLFNLVLIYNPWVFSVFLSNCYVFCIIFL